MKISFWTPTASCGLQLRHAFVDRAEDRRFLRRVAPGRIIPLLAEPFHHRPLDRRARRPDIDRQLVGIEQARRILPRLLGIAAHLGPGFGETFGRVEISQPAAIERRALEDAVDIAADQHHRQARRLGRHVGAAQPVRRVFAVDLLLGPQPAQDLEVAVHDPAALVERHADRVELALVPARGHAEQQPSSGNQIEARQLLRQHHRVAQRQYQHPGAELDPRWSAPPPR